MRADRISRLTEAQCECLRLVWERLNSKEIGRRLGISPHTVDQRLRNAIQALEVSSRVEAARVLAEAEGRAAYQPAVYQPSRVQSAAESGFIGSPEQPGIEQPTSNLHVAQEEQATYAVTEPTYASPAWRLPFPTRGRLSNDLNILQRLAWIAALGIGAALAFGMLIASLDALSRSVG